MNCIRCGRTVDGDHLLCAVCGGREPASEPSAEKPLPPSEPKLPQPAQKKKRRKIRSAVHRRLRRALIITVAVCVLLAASAGVLGWKYWFTHGQLVQDEADAEELRQLQNEREALNITLLNAQSQLETAKEKISNQNTQLASLESKLSEAESVNDQASASADQLTREVAVLSDQNESYGGQIETQQAELEQLQLQLEAALSELESAQTQLAEKQAEVDELNRTVTRYKAQTTFFNRNVGFVCASDRSYYHCYTCNRLDLTGSWWLVRTDETRTYSPCPDCH